MHPFRKVNRGMLLTLAVLAILIVYLAVVALQQSVQKEEIRNICTEALELMSEEIILPENARLSSENYSEESYNSRVKEVQTHMEKYQAESTTLPACIATAFRMQADLGTYFTSYENTNALDFKCLFAGDMVTVTFTTLLTYDLAGNELQKTEEPHRERVSQRFILKRENGTWKIVVFDVALPASVTEYPEYY